MSAPWVVLHVVEWLVLVGVMVVVLALARQVGVLLLRLGPSEPKDVGHGPQLGTAAPLLGASRSGGELAYGEFSGGTLVLFVSAGCSVCDLTIAALRRLRTRWADMAWCAGVTGDDEGVADVGARAGLGPERLFVTPELWWHFGVPEVPFAVFIDADGVVRARGICNNREHLEELVLEGRRRAAHARRETADEAAV